MTTLPLSELLGAPVYDPSGAETGRVREVTLAQRVELIRSESCSKSTLLY
jgi:sporulation protein YlmC with PRC-barrel domain